MMTAAALRTERIRFDILAELRRRERELEPPPTIGELATMLGYSGSSPALFHLRRMRDDGLVTWQTRATRTLQMTDAGRAALGGQRAA
jgi:SOS-response transcriptional repressor LexA